MSFEETVITLFAKVTDEVHIQGVALNKVLSELTESIREKEKAQDKRIEEIEKVTLPLKPITDFFIGNKYVLVGGLSMVIFLGFSAFNIGIYALNEATGLNKLLAIEKKNEATLKRLCSYLKVVCE